MDSLAIKTVSVIDNKTEAHRAVKAHLKKSREFRLGCCYRTAEDALKDIARHRPEMVLINVRLPGICGIECTHTFKKILPNLRVIVFSEVAGLTSFIRAFQAGADGFFVWPGTAESVQGITRNALTGWRPFSKEIQKLLVERLTTASVLANPNVWLTPTEQKTIAYLTLGLSDKEIARLEGIATATVHSRTLHVYRKLDAHSRREAVGSFLGFKQKTPATVRPWFALFVHNDAITFCTICLIAMFDGTIDIRFEISLYPDCQNGGLGRVGILLWSSDPRWYQCSFRNSSDEWRAIQFFGNRPTIRWTSSLRTSHLYFHLPMRWLDDSTPLQALRS